MATERDVRDSAELVRLYGDGLQPPAIAEAIGRSEQWVRRELAALGGEALWRPRCMDDDDFRAWREQNERVGFRRAARPCEDCLLGYAIEKRAEGRCNGTPAGAQEDEETMTELGPAPVRPQPASRPATSGSELAIALDLPCPSCANAPICRIRPTLERRLERVPAALPRLDPVITVELEATVTCALYRTEGR